jgi:hypothetical protein
MAKLCKLAAAPTEDDTRVSAVLRLSLVEGHSVFYRVEVVERGSRRRRGTRIRGIGGFADLRQLRLVSDDVR